MSNIGAVCCVWHAEVPFSRQYFFIFIISIMREYVVCVFTLINTYVHACMRNGERHPCNTKSDPRFGTAICPPFLEFLAVIAVFAAGKTKNRRAYKRDSALQIPMRTNLNFLQISQDHYFHTLHICLSTLEVFRSDSGRQGQHFVARSNNSPSSVFSNFVCFLQDHCFCKLRICSSTFMVFRLDSGKQRQYFCLRCRATLTS